MAVMTSIKLAAQIRSIKGNSSKLKTQIQDTLISCAYYAAKDGQVTPFNQLLEAVGTSARIKGLTMWGEVYGFVQVKQGKFVLNKTQRKEANITDEASFASFEATMRAAPLWCDLVPKESTTSIFDASVYLDHVIAKLDKEGASTAKAFLMDAVDKYKKADAMIKLQLEAMEEAPL